MIVGLIILLLVQIVFVGGCIFYYLEGKMNGVSCICMVLAQLCSIGCSLMMLFGLFHPNFPPIQE